MDCRHWKKCILTRQRSHYNAGIRTQITVGPKSFCKLWYYTKHQHDSSSDKSQTESSRLEQPVVAKDREEVPSATSLPVFQRCLKFELFRGAITSKIKHATKHETSPARFAQLLQHSLAFCFSLQPMTVYSPGLDGTPSLAASYNKMLMRVATVVQVLQDLFYVLLYVLFYLWSLLKRSFGPDRGTSRDWHHFL